MNDSAYNELRDNVISLIASGYEVMLFHQGFGETVVFAQLLYKYRQMSGHKLLLIIKETSRKDILENCPYIDEILLVDEETFVQLSQDGMLRIYGRISSFFDLHNIIGIDKSNVKSEVCDFLRIPKDTSLKPYDIPDVNANWEEYFEANNLQLGKTVYLVPHAVFLGNAVPESLWERLVEGIRKKGYSVIVNMPEEYIPGVPYAYFDMKVSLSLARRCGYVVGVRTGFMDLAAVFTDCKLQMIYPDDSHKAWEIWKKDNRQVTATKDYALEYMKAWGIKNIFGRNDACEYVYDGINTTIEKILNNLD